MVATSVLVHVIVVPLALLVFNIVFLGRPRHPCPSLVVPLLLLSELGPCIAFQSSMVFKLDRWREEKIEEQFTRYNYYIRLE